MSFEDLRKYPMDRFEKLARQAGINVVRGVVWSGVPWLGGELLWAEPYGPVLLHYKQEQIPTWEQIERFGELVAAEAQRS
jgi:hypothetical protein